MEERIEACSAVGVVYGVGSAEDSFGVEVDGFVEVLRTVRLVALLLQLRRVLFPLGLIECEDGVLVAIGKLACGLDGGDFGLRRSCFGAGVLLGSIGIFLCLLLFPAPLDRTAGVFLVLMRNDGSALVQALSTAQWYGTDAVRAWFPAMDDIGDPQRLTELLLLLM